MSVGAVGWEEVFSGPHMKLFFRDFPTSNKVCFTFDSLDTRSFPPHLPAADLIRSQSSAHVHLTTLQDDWYQNDDFAPCSDSMKLVSQRFEHVVNYGGSMGGFGALLFSRLTNASRVVAIAPQFSINPISAPFETRWLHLVKDLKFLKDATIGKFKEDAEIYVILDLACKLDRLHAGLLKSNVKINTLYLPFSGHYPLQVLKGQISEYLVECLFGEVDYRKLAYIRRQSRLRAARYFNEMAIWFSRRRNYSKAMTALTRAYAISPEHPSVVESTFQVLQSWPDTIAIQHMLLRLLKYEQPQWQHYNGTEAAIWAQIKASNNQKS